ncbi:MAG: ATP-binding protein [Thermodesulfobacteriota bacterium]|nr:ATP-binding protein [Thermodesulfobacteriota bacterium]
MQPLSLEFATDDSKAGFRLHRLEMLNWGTFHRHVWTIEPGGDNALLTGDIGSGKSTLVDAVTTLLVPHQRIVYNKAAGAETKERSLYSYIRGEYKSAKDDLTQSSRAVALRDDGSYTVLLAHFHNQGLGHNVTLAQVFWLKDGKRNPERFFVVSHLSLTIADHFCNFGSNLLDLKKRLRKTAKVEVLEKFKDYGSRFRQLFGIHSEQALELFYQTVSMKSVGNLTDFVRHHMLDEGRVEARIDELRRNFENLNQAHMAVRKAREQIERLQPLVKDGERCRSVQGSIEELCSCRSALEPYFAQQKGKLLTIRIERLELDLHKVSHHLETVKGEITRLRQQEDKLKTAIEQSGGRRLQQIEDEIVNLGSERDKKLAKCEEYQRFQEHLGLDKVANEEGFYRNLVQGRELLQEVATAIEELKKVEIDLGIELKEVKRQHEQLERELVSLRQRKSNIPLRNLEMRRAMAEVLGVDEDELPFVGELLQVDENEAVWQGAIERLLHNFALSLLVPEHYYAQVSHYVERTHLKGRLVYFRVKEDDVKAVDRVKPQALCSKLRIRPESIFYAWLESYLASRFGYICCDDMETFHRLPRAVTRSGQIKSGGQRHEKDDRRSIHDHSRYVLGWSNKDKIAALEQQQQGLQRDGLAIADKLSELAVQQKHSGEQRDMSRDLLHIEEYVEIDWQPLVRLIQGLQEEQAEIERSSDQLQTLRQQLELTAEEIGIKENRRSSLTEKLGDVKSQLRTAHTEFEEAYECVAALAADVQEQLLPLLDSWCEQLNTPVTLRNIKKGEQEVRAALQGRINSETAKVKTLLERITRQMVAFKNDFPAETTELDASLEAIDEFGEMFCRLQGEDLPRHEIRFKQLLNEGTINSIALLQNQLEKEQQQIKEKIEMINTSLCQIEYDSGTFIELVMDKCQDAEVRDFQQELKQCLARTLDEEELYSEEKFHQVKAIIDRFNGRQGFIELDRRWTRKVTDVRNWFAFSASERWLEDGNEKEYYSDTSGKSGGQKEKLAYTILASALAYQFGLEWGATTSRSFRFVVIDEAFGKGSDESTRYALELFKKLNLQLLIVTPMQKIHIIEDYVRTVHYVHNQDGENSLLRNLSIEEYRAEKAQFQGAVHQ